MDEKYVSKICVPYKTYHLITPEYSDNDTDTSDSMRLIAASNIRLFMQISTFWT